MSYTTVFIIVLLAFGSGYAFAIHMLSRRIALERFLVLERLYSATKDFYSANDMDDLEIHGDRIQKLVTALGRKN